MSLYAAVVATVIAAFALSMVACDSGKAPSKAPPPIIGGVPDPKPKTEADREWDAVQTCQFAIMAGLHDPANATFPEVSSSYRKLANGVYTTQVEVRGKNAFNATRLVTFECKIDAKTMDLKSIKQLRD